jgi:hypothetical protein
LPFSKDLTDLLIYGRKSWTASTDAAVKVPDLYETFEEAARMVLRL